MTDSTFTFDINETPFSRFGSFFALAPDTDQEGSLLLRDQRSLGREIRLFRLTPLQAGGLARAELHVSATELSWTNEEGSISICLGNDRSVSFRGQGLGLLLEAFNGYYDTLLQISDSSWQYDSYSRENKYTLRMLSGSCRVDAPWKTVGHERVNLTLSAADNSTWEAEIEEHRVLPQGQSFIDYEAALAAVQSDWSGYTSALPPVPAKYEQACMLAAYNVWSCGVRAEGALPRPAIYMSMSHMSAIWSWDNCFNALSVAQRNPELAADQLLIFADTQDESGVFADTIDTDGVSYSCTKPPVQAWTLAKLQELNPVFSEEPYFTSLYEMILKNVRFWLTCRQSGDSLPVYYHGNDSGWDNSSIFFEGNPVEAPDLSAHLIRSCDLLAGMAQHLGRLDEQQWLEQQADDLYGRLMDRLYVDGHFVARRHGEIVPQYKSLILYLPLVIHYRLPQAVVRRLSAELLEKHLTPAGLATEAPDSPLYGEDSYWRGPVWSPPTILLADALFEAGETEAADQIVERFLEAGSKSGMAENFNPRTLEGNRDRSITLTAAVYLVLARLWQERHQG